MCWFIYILVVWLADLFIYWSIDLVDCMVDKSIGRWVDLFIYFQADSKTIIDKETSKYWYTYKL